MSSSASEEEVRQAPEPFGISSRQQKFCSYQEATVNHLTELNVAIKVYN